ncbi:MAG TPA: ABC transporter substrate-binding protein [Burkholderiales bacterium]|nr:ABC transporter substrate-binding protein [Burkholderiales bacterium]
MKIFRSILLTFASLSVGIAQAESGVTDTTILMGQSTPLTGLAAGLGQEMTVGVKAYFDKVNKEGGVHGRKLELVTLDDGYEPARAEANTTQLIEQKKVFALIGYVGTPTSNAANPVFTKAKVPFIGPFTGAMSLREPFNRYIFNVRASYNDEGVAIVNQLNTFGASRIAIFHQDDAYGKAVMNGVVAAMKTRGQEPIVTATVPRNSLDVEDAAQKIIKANPTGIAMGCTYPACAALIKRLKTARIQPTYLTVSFGGMSNDSIEEKSAGAGLGIVQVMPYPWNNAIAVVRDYQRAMTTINRTAYSYPAMEGFIAAKVFVEGLRKAGPNLTREKFIDAMETLRPFDVGGFTVSYSPTNHNGSTFTEQTIVGANGKIIR